MDRKEEQGDITNRICLSIVVYSLVLVVFIAASEFAGLSVAYTVGIAFSVWLIIRTYRRKKTGTFNGSLLI